jgi:hypothetical protein
MKMGMSRVSGGDESSAPRFPTKDGFGDWIIEERRGISITSFTLSTFCCDWRNSVVFLSAANRVSQHERSKYVEMRRPSACQSSLHIVQNGELCSFTIGHEATTTGTPTLKRANTAASDKATMRYGRFDVMRSMEQHQAPVRSGDFYASMKILQNDDIINQFSQIEEPQPMLILNSGCDGENISTVREGIVTESLKRIVPFGGPT